jgi:hypothetical protein
MAVLVAVSGLLQYSGKTLKAGRGGELPRMKRDR